MGDNSKIEWTDASWNPIVGCDRVSSGCAHCYAIREVNRLAANPTVGATYAGLVERHRNGHLDWTGVVRFLPERLELPLRWKRPRRIFVASMSDPFHEAVPDAFLDRMFEVMWQASWHTFQLLTKRPARMLEYFGRWQATGTDHYFSLPGKRILWPLRNVWLGVSVENQQAADERIPLLLQTPAAVRFLSCEPLLGPVDLCRWLECPAARLGLPGGCDGPLCEHHELERIHWVIVGGESGGPPERALVRRCSWCKGADPKMCPHCAGKVWLPKPDRIEWVRSLRDQCIAAGVPFHFKQWGGLHSKRGGRLLDGRTWDEMPPIGREARS